MSLRGVLLAALVAGCPGGPPAPETAPPAAPETSRADGDETSGIERSRPEPPPETGATRPSGPGSEGVRCTFEAADGALVLSVENPTSAPVEIPDPEDPGAVRWFADDRLVSAAVPGRPPRTRILGPGRTLRARHGHPPGGADVTRARLEAPPPAHALDCPPARPALP